jgi:hypothetical protein
MADDILSDEKGHIHRFIEWLHMDPLMFRRWLRAFIAWLAGILTMVISSGMEVALNWTWHDWTKRIGVAALFGIVGAINLGDKNLPVDPAVKP